MKWFVLIFIASLSYTTHAQSIEDLVHKTKVDYTGESGKVVFPSWSDEEIKTYQFRVVNLPDSEAKLNEQISNFLNQLGSDTSIRNDFQEYFREAFSNEVEGHLRFYGETPPGYEDVEHWHPEVKTIYVSVYLLCDKTLIVHGGILYNVVREKNEDFPDPPYKMESQMYSTFQYFNIETGERIDPSSIIKTSKSFHRLIRSHLPMHFEDLISDDEIEHGFPIFVGGSFYYMLQGNNNVDNDGGAVTSLHVRVPLDEIQRYIVKSGAFEKYRTLRPSNPTGVRRYDYRLSSRIYGSNYNAAVPYDIVEEIDEKYDYTSCSIYRLNPSNDTVKVGVLTYRPDGRPISKTYSSLSKYEPLDSLSYEYSSKGLLLAVHHYKFKKWGWVNHLSMIYDENGTLTEEIEYLLDNDRPTDDRYIRYFTYFDGFFVVDNFTIYFGEVANSEYAFYCYNGNYDEFGRYNRGEPFSTLDELKMVQMPDGQRLTRTNGSGDIQDLYYQVIEDGRIVKMTIGNYYRTVPEYDEENRIVGYSSEYKEHGSIDFAWSGESHIQYGSNGLPVEMIRSSKDYKTGRRVDDTYWFRYD
ncbi:MAG: hypothetical protein QNK23_09240 [Crocinitomicaceae bacterium]|nr:hypothetical protein [Crocinitomicaceae bacterium]